MKHTSEALQTMGLKVTDADNIMLDLEDSTSDMNALTTTLGRVQPWDQASRTNVNPAVMAAYTLPKVQVQFG